MKTIKLLCFAVVLAFSMLAQAGGVGAPPIDPPAVNQPQNPIAEDGFWGWAGNAAMKAAGINFDFNKDIAKQLVNLTGLKEAVNGLIKDASPFDKARETAKKITSGVDSPATILFLLMSTILVCWSGLRMIGGEDVSELIETAVTISFFTFLFTGYDWVFGQSLPNFFSGWADSLYSAATGETGGVGGAAGGLVEAIFTVVMKATVAQIENVISFFFMFAMIFVIFTLPAIYKLSMAAVTIVSIFLLANGAAAVALALGPVAIAFGILPFTRQVFFGWLGVITAALAIKVIAAATLPVFLLFSDQLTSQFGNFSNGGGFLGASAIKDTIMLLIFAQVLSTLIAMIPDTAFAIFGGIMGGAMKLGSKSQEWNSGGNKEAAGEAKKSYSNTKDGVAAVKAAATKFISKGLM